MQPKECRDFNLTIQRYIRYETLKIGGPISESSGQLLWSCIVRDDETKYDLWYMWSNADTNYQQTQENETVYIYKSCSRHSWD